MPIKSAGVLTHVACQCLLLACLVPCIVTAATNISTISPAAITTSSQYQDSCDFYAFVAPAHYYQGFTITLSPVGKSDNDLFLYTSAPAQSECQTRSSGSAVDYSADHSPGAASTPEVISVAPSTSYFTGPGQVRPPCCAMHQHIQSLFLSCLTCRSFILWCTFIRPRFSRTIIPVATACRSPVWRPPVPHKQPVIPAHQVQPCHAHIPQLPQQADRSPAPSPCQSHLVLQHHSLNQLLLLHPSLTQGLAPVTLRR
jgi:hypothetical protein